MVFIALVIWTFASASQLISSQLTSLMYLSIPIFLMLFECILKRYVIGNPIPRNLSVLFWFLFYYKIYSFCSRSSALPRLFLILSILWTVAILCYSAQFWSGLQKSSQTGLWLFKTADPVFGWSLSTPTSVIDIISLGKYLEILFCYILSIHS